MVHHGLSSTFRHATLVLTALSLAACASARIPEKTSPTAGGGSGSPNQPTDQIALAASLAAHGYRTNSPLSLMAAAQILMENPPGVFTATPDETVTPPATKPGPRVQLDPQRLLAAAQNLARDNSNITAVVSQLQERANAGSRGARGGAQAGSGIVVAGGTNTYHIEFYGKETASVRIRGDGDTDLDCYVYNSSGTLVALDNDRTDFCVLDWYPQYTGPYRIVIRNLGSVYNAYQIVTN